MARELHPTLTTSADENRTYRHNGSGYPMTDQDPAAMRGSRAWESIGLGMLRLEIDVYIEKGRQMEGL